jgi:dihydrolipoamide dehydrogenase
MATNVPGVYAIGDVIGGYLLAHVASHEGIVAAENAAGHKAVMQYKTIPGVIYTHPEVASVGLTEQAARDKGLVVKTGRFPFSANGRAIASSATEGLVKIVSEASTQEVLGMHIVGEEADNLLLEGMADLTLEATLDEITHLVHPHPSLGEAVAEAALDAQGRVIHLPPRKK